MSPRVAASQLSDRAADVLRQVFAAVQADFAFRLWDGKTVAFGAAPPAFTVVIPAPETFFRLMRDPTPFVFGEAYVESAIDIEGDLFDAMHVANALENMHLPLAQRLRLLLSLGAGALLPPKSVRGRPVGERGGGAAVAPPQADR